MTESWSYDRLSGRVKNGDGLTIATYVYEEHGHLMAAAPEMFDILHHLAHEIAMGRLQLDVWQDGYLHAAIRKAIGEG